MRPGPNNRRMRGRGNNNRRGPSKNQNIDSSGPDIKVRGNSQQLVDKYLQLSRDAAISGDPITAENFSQHAEHYFRVQTGNGEDKSQRQSGRNQGQGRNQNRGQVQAQPRDGGGGGGEASPGNGSDNGSVGADPAEAPQPAAPETKSDAAPETKSDAGTGTESGEPKTA